MVQSSTDRNWISLSDAIRHIVESSLLDEFSAAELIQAGLTRGKLRSRARAVRTLERKADLTLDYPSCRAAGEAFEQIPREFWKAGSRFSSRLFEELLFGSPVSIAMPETPDYEIEDLELSEADLRGWLLSEGSVSISPSLRGRRPKEQAWAYLITLLIEETRESGLTEDDFPNPTSLLRLLHQDWEEREDNANVQAIDDDPSILHDRSISRVLEDVWETIVRGASK